MPKNKKQESSSDSDEGPVDRNIPPEKKAKMGKKTVNTQSQGSKTDEPTWVLEKKKMVKLREFNGKVLIDIREFYEKDGNVLPTKKGISLNPVQWRKLMSLSEEITEKLSTMS